MSSILIVDAANVVGSVPDGWWKDRAGAAGRLQRALAAADLGYDEVVLVVEGQARRGAAAGREGVLVTVHAPGIGDDEIVEQVRARPDDDVSVATADAGLIARIPQARLVGPRQLRARLPRDA